MQSKNGGGNIISDKRPIEINVKKMYARNREMAEENENRGAKKWQRNQNSRYKDYSDRLKKSDTNSKEMAEENENILNKFISR